MADKKRGNRSLKQFNAFAMHICKIAGIITPVCAGAPLSKRFGWPKDGFRLGGKKIAAMCHTRGFRTQIRLGVKRTKCLCDPAGASIVLLGIVILA